MARARARVPLVCRALCLAHFANRLAAVAGAGAPWRSALRAKLRSAFSSAGIRSLAAAAAAAAAAAF